MPVITQSPVLNQDPALLFKATTLAVKTNSAIDSETPHALAADRLSVKTPSPLIPVSAAAIALAAPIIAHRLTQPSIKAFSTPGVLGTTAAAGVTLAASDWLSQKLYPGQTDKRKHALVGGGIAAIGSGVTLAITKNRLTSALTGIGLAVVAGAGKEIYDKVSGKGTPDRHDFYITALGGIAVGASFTIPFK